MAIVIDEFQVPIGSDEIIGTIEKYRDRRYGRPAFTLYHTIEHGTSGYTRWTDDYISAGMVRIHLTPIEGGARIRVELHKIKDRVALEKYAQELREAIRQAYQPTGSTLEVLPTNRDRLSYRELEIANLLADGRTKQEIADKLMIQPNTVKTHTTHIADKLEIKSKGRYALILRQMGYGTGDRK